MSMHPELDARELESARAWDAEQIAPKSFGRMLRAILRSRAIKLLVKIAGKPAA